jgi:hypothetical protein
MAKIEQTVTVKFDPRDLDRLTEAIRRAMGPKPTEALTGGEPEPITITTHDRPALSLGAMSTTTTRYLFIDGLNQQHWVPSERAGRDRGWRQAFFLPGR